MERYQGEKCNSNYILVLISKPTFLFTMIFETYTFAIFIHFQPQRSMLGEREISTCRCFLISLRLDFFPLK